MKATPHGSAVRQVAPAGRVEARGKFLFAGGEKFFLRGVTYGTFRPHPDGHDYPSPDAVAGDFARMAASGINAVRTYTVPPRWLLDLADDHGVRVMVGLPWEQHVAFLDERSRLRSIEQRVREGVRACAGHPAILCYAVGNEVPASIVRWYRRQRVERWIERLYRAVKEEDEAALVTYVNYPSTEYLDLPFLDLVCFNVFLEEEEKLEAYLARLHNLAGDRPLVVTELGLDSRRHGEAAQAIVLGWQARTVFGSGCAGAFVFSWTDEWHRGGQDVEDWDFGLTDRNRRPKPALAAVREAYAEVPFPSGVQWPRITVVVCTHNGGATLGTCLQELEALDYPDYEVIVVDDGSADATAEIASAHDVRLIRTENQGLSAARNVGISAASGELVAFIDDDAWPDPHWLTYLASEFIRTPHAGVGGPNIPPATDGPVAACIANAPGGPVHVLLSDRQAEHIPGCNMAFRKECLEAVDGFDPRFRIAGDDVDICWRLQSQGWTLGFSPAAVVWHRRRSSVRAFLRQQREYGKAEAMLERKWPERYNRGGHVAWSGQIYGGTRVSPLPFRSRIYYGPWGTGAFQSIYQRSPGLLSSLPALPEWYLVVAALSVYVSLALHWRPLLVAAPLLALSLGLLIAAAIAGGVRARFVRAPRSRVERAKLRALTSALFLLQPLARLLGRIRGGLTPWRRRGAVGFAFPMRHTRTLWSERYHPAESLLATIEASLRADGAFVRRGSNFDRWDLLVRGGAFGGAHLRTLTEEHRRGAQLVRARIWPKWSRGGSVLALFFAALAVGAGLDGAWPGAGVLAAASVALVISSVRSCSQATASLLRAFERLASPAEDDLQLALAQAIESARAGERVKHGAAESTVRTRA